MQMNSFRVGIAVGLAVLCMCISPHLHAESMSPGKQLVSGELAHTLPGIDEEWMREGLRRAELLRDRNLLCDQIPEFVMNALPVDATAGKGQARSSSGGVVDWPVSPDVLETLSVRVRAVIASDDDGGRRTPVTPEQIRLWVDQANMILADSAIRLEFDPSVGSDDWIELKSTLLNTMTGNSNPQWEEQRTLANTIAASTPDRMMVLFRWGTGVNPTGGGFSWTDNDFIVMPGFFTTQVCGEQNIGLLAHEVGHYLGLPHTFSWIASTINQVESFFVINNHNTQVFEGDGRDETEPDPFVSQFGPQCVFDSLELDGVSLVLPRENAMSYYHPVSGFVSSQTSTMRQTLMLRTGMSLSGEDNTIEAVEAEGLSSTVTGGGLSTQDMRGFLGRWSDDLQLLWLDGEVGDTLTTSIEAPAAGRYRVYGSFTAAPRFGIVEHRFNGQTGDALDLYAGIVLNTGQVYLGEYALEQGENELVVEVVGTNPRVSFPNYGYGADYFVLESVCRADFNGDGELNFLDVSAFLMAFGQQDLGADFLDDGSFNFLDVSAFLQDFGAGCP
jgi:hypothetical protein